MSSTPEPEPTDSPTLRLVRRIVDVQPAELVPLLLGVLYFFLLLSGYYILRPIRESFGISSGTGQLPALMYGTVVAMVLINPLYSSLVARVPRSRVVPLVYRGFIVLLLGFSFGLRLLEGDAILWTGRAFYVFLSVFNYFVVSIFWTVFADLFGPDRAKRLFGLAAVGGSLGAILGSSLTRFLVETLGPANLLILSCLFLEGAVRAARAVMGRFSATAAEDASRSGTRLQARGDIALGGSMWAGMRAAFRSPYLLCVSAYVLLYGLSSTFAYFFQAEVVAAASESDTVRTKIFANLDLWVSLVTLCFQLLVAGRLLKWFGAGITLIVLPVYSLLGFLLLASGWIPAGSLLLVFSLFQILRRSLGYGIARPAREVLWTVLTPEEKYKAKNLVDLAVPRFGDVVGAKVSGGIQAAGLGLVALALTAAPLALLWIGTGLALGAGFERRDPTSRTEG